MQVYLQARAARCLVDGLRGGTILGVSAMGRADAPPDSVTERLHAVAWRGAALAAEGRPHRRHTTSTTRWRPLGKEETVTTTSSRKAADRAPRADTTYADVGGGSWQGGPDLIE